MDTSVKSKKIYLLYNASRVIQYNFIKNGMLKRDEKITLFGMRDSKGNIYTAEDYLQIYDITIDREKDGIKI